MSPLQASIIVPLVLFLIIVTVISLNIHVAKGKITNWKGGSAFWFVYTMGKTLSRRKSASSWMQRLAYHEADAHRLAKYQASATLELMFCAIIWFSIASMLMAN
jgi:hypothetical protein